MSAFDYAFLVAFNLGIMTLLHLKNASFIIDLVLDYYLL